MNLHGSSISAAVALTPRPPHTPSPNILYRIIAVSRIAAIRAWRLLLWLIVLFSRSVRHVEAKTFQTLVELKCKLRTVMASKELSWRFVVNRLELSITAT